jgi:hypothetical protein
VLAAFYFHLLSSLSNGAFLAVFGGRGRESYDYIVFTFIRFPRIIL